MTVMWTVLKQVFFGDQLFLQTNENRVEKQTFIYTPNTLLKILYTILNTLLKLNTYHLYVQ